MIKIRVLQSSDLEETMTRLKSHKAKWIIFTALKFIQLCLIFSSIFTIYIPQKMNYYRYSFSNIIILDHLVNVCNISKLMWIIFHSIPLTNKSFSRRGRNIIRRLKHFCWNLLELVNKSLLLCCESILIWRCRSGSSRNDGR